MSDEPDLAARLARAEAGMSSAQRARVEELRANFLIEDDHRGTLHFNVPAGSELVLARSKSTGKVAWVEIIEPEPTFRWCWDTGEPR